VFWGSYRDAKAFEVYVEHFLAPSLSQGQVVVMDNLGAHRPKRIRELIEARGAELVFVPSYSPDLNPIEQAFSKIKNILRMLGARTHEALLAAMEEALSKVTPADAAGWFGHCGYPVEVQYLWIPLLELCHGEVWRKSGESVAWL
jgi:transposase